MIVVLYVACAIACWAVGHLLGIKNGTGGAMAAGYGGGAVLTALVLTLIAYRNSASAAATAAHQDEELARSYEEQRRRQKTTERQIERLVASQAMQLASTRQRWWETVLAPGATDRHLAEEALKALYNGEAKVKWPRMPRVIWCESPLALIEAAGETQGGADVSQALIYARDPRVESALARRVSDDPGALARALREGLANQSADRIFTAVWDTVQNQVTHPLSTQQAWESVQGSIWTRGWDGYFDWIEIDQARLADSLALSRFLHDHWEISVNEARLTLAASCSGFVLRENVALLSERHCRLERDDRGRLHSDHGPAIAWPDGFAIYAWHGVRVPAHVIEDPESFQPRTIMSEENIEVRRAMIECIGYQRFLDSCNAQPARQDDYGRLWRIPLPDDEPLVVVEVRNATLEPDGTRKDYFLRVPPTIKSARDAVAWTFGIAPEQYFPRFES